MKGWLLWGEPGANVAESWCRAASGLSHGQVARRRVGWERAVSEVLKGWCRCRGV